MNRKIDRIITLASAVINNNEGKILLLKRSAVASYPNHWQFVEGKIEADEKPDEALKREIQEEIGATVRNMQLSVSNYSETEANGQNILCFRIVFTVDLDSTEVRLSNEHNDFGWYSEDEALALPLLPGVSQVIKELIS